MHSSSPHYILSDILDRNAGDPARCDRIAFSQGSQQQSFADLQARSRKLAQALQGLGIVHGDRVCILMGNRLAWPEALFAVTSLGAVVVAVNVLLSGSDVNAVLDDARPRALLVDVSAESALAAMTQLPEWVITVGEVAFAHHDKTVDYESLLSRGDEAGVSQAVSPGDPAMMYYTSGTTGKPKGTLHSHQGILWNTHHQIADLRLSPDETYLVVPSLSWGAGFHDVTLALMWIGGRSELLPTGSGALDRIVSAVESTRAQRTILVPTLLKQLLSNSAHTKRLRASALRYVMSGAEPLHAALTANFVAELPDCGLFQTYGMSEFPIVATVAVPEEAVSHAGQAGRASSVTTLAVRLADDTIARQGEGEILLRSAATMLEYYEKPGATAQTMRGGWLHTGDWGRIDEQGNLTIAGRVKEMIISGGLNIYPREIEDVIYQIPEVSEAAVIGVEDARWGEHPVAVVVSTGDAEAMREKTHAVCAQNLSRFKLPRQVIVRREPLPKTVTGKILKRELKPWVEQYLES